MAEKGKLVADPKSAKDKPMSPEEVLAMLEQLETYKQPAIEKLLEDRRSIDEKLLKLGYAETPFKQVKRSELPRSKGQGKPGASCPICKFATEPYHDGRQHRNQAQKTPFTDEELAAKKLSKVALQ